MSSFSMFVVVFLTVGSAVTVYGEKKCNITSNVSISLNKPDACPYEPVTAQCNVTGPPNLFLSWDCQASNERLVFCDQMAVDLDCEFGTVYDISSKCVCSDTVIISEATFDLSPMGDMMLYCSNGDSDQRQGVPVAVKALSTPQLYCTTVDMDNNVQYGARVWWIVKDTDTYNDVEYIVSVVNSSFPTPMDITTNQTTITLNLFYGVNYTIAVIAKRCGGNVSSEPSEECLLYNPEISTVITPTSTVVPMTPSRGKSNSAVVGGIISAVILLLIAMAIGFGLVLLLYYKCRNQDWKQVEVRGEDHQDGVELSKFQTNFTMITNEESRERSGVGAILVDGEFVYYSCTEEEDGHEPKKFILRKCDDKGRFICGVSCPEFIRGIGMDNSGCVYVLCSGSNSKVVKFDRDLQCLRKTHNDYYVIFGKPYGMLVTSDHVFVTSKEKSRICIFDLDLNYQCNLKLSEGPIGITALDNKYIVTFEAAIGVIDINFDENKYRERKLKCVRMKNGKNKKFRAGYILRAICVCDQYIFVTEVHDAADGHAADGRLLCLQYIERSGLEMVDAQSQCCTNNCSTESKGKRCNAIVVTSYNGAIYYSEGSYGERFHIAKKNICGNKLFDVPSI